MSKIAERNWKRAADFTDEEKWVIAERRKHQTAAELADVFLTTPQTIASIARQAQEQTP